MKIETLIYAYLAVCTGMILFNCAYAILFRRQNRVIRRHAARLEKRIMEQIERVKAGEQTEAGHMKLLRKKLRRTDYLMAFDEAMENISEREPEAAGKYLVQIRPVFARLAAEKQYFGAVKTAHFAYILQKYRIMEENPDVSLIRMMERLLKEKSIYCRENALSAIFSTGDCGCVLRALHTVDENQIFHHDKLLTDGLLTFAGDLGELAETLWKSFDKFSIGMRVVILNFIRFSGADMGGELLALLADRAQDDEIRFSCIRYFGKYPCDEAFPILLYFVENPEDNRWEYAAVAASALSSYPGARTVSALKKALRSPNWYIRLNAADSLESLNLTYMELSDVMEGRDRYAREILQYCLDVRNAREFQEAVPI